MRKRDKADLPLRPQTLESGLRAAFFLGNRGRTGDFENCASTATMPGAYWSVSSMAFRVFLGNFDSTNSYDRRTSISRSGLLSSHSAGSI